MRILFMTSSPIWSNNLPMGFKKAGHDIKISGPLSENIIKNAISEFRPHFMMSMGWSQDQALNIQACIHDNAKKMNIPNIFWSLEDPIHTEYFTVPLIQVLKPDFIFTICESSIADFGKMGFKAAHLDFAYEPDIHNKTIKEGRFSCNIAVVANAYPFLLQKPDLLRLKSINTLISPLIKQNIPVDFWGNDWDKSSHYLGRRVSQKHLHGCLPYLDSNKVYSSAKLIIGLQNHSHQVTQRTYEILGSEGFLITSDTPEIRKLFVPGRDLVVSPSPAETLKIVKHYLNNPKEREAISKQGKLSVSNHTYKDRAEYIIAVLKSRNILPKD